MAKIFRANDTRNAKVDLTANQMTMLSKATSPGTMRGTIVLTNNNAPGGGTAWIAFGQEAAKESGLPLLAGQTIAFALDSAYHPPQDIVTAYTETAGTSIAVFEELGADVNAGSY